MPTKTIKFFLLLGEKDLHVGSEVGKILNEQFDLLP
jgi:hypothetical protein